MTLAIERFRPEDQSAVRALILAGLGEHWGLIDAELNPDLDDIGATYGDGDDPGRERRRRDRRRRHPRARGIRRGEVKRMSVAREHRRAGVASAMLRELVAVARHRGSRALILETTATWTDAIQFYESFGFTFTHQEDGEFGPDAHFRLDL